MRFRNCLGMIWSVSMLARYSGATKPLCLRNGCINSSLESPVAHVDEVSGNGGGSGHHGTDQMSAPAASLAPFKVPVAGGGAALARLKNVRIHAQAHGAAGLAPLEPGIDEGLV